jgi:hypothetical protein
MYWLLCAEPGIDGLIFRVKKESHTAEGNNICEWCKFIMHEIENCQREKHKEDCSGEGTTLAHVQDILIQATINCRDLWMRDGADATQQNLQYLMLLACAVKPFLDYTGMIRAKLSITVLQRIADDGNVRLNTLKLGDWVSAPLATVDFSVKPPVGE